MPALLEKAPLREQAQAHEIHDGQFKVVGIPFHPGVSGGLCGNNSTSEHRSSLVDKSRSPMGNPGGLHDF